MSLCCGPSRDGDPAPFTDILAPVPDQSCADSAGHVGRGASACSTSAVALPDPGSAPVADMPGMARIEAGPFLMGNESPDAFPGDGEGPVREVVVDRFLIDTTAVTNADFAAFAAATGYVTDAERFGWSFVFEGLIEGRNRDHLMDGLVPGAPWWRAVRGADYAHPFGPASGIDEIGDHPVVHVSWNDASAYAAWSGKRLPTEAEWEKACRGGLSQTQFPWGDELEPGGEHRMNVWQGDFPRHNSGVDGYLATAPAASFEPNGYGLHNMTGNVWEWVADFFSPSWHVAAADRTRVNPCGPVTGQGRVLRGGSYLCHASYCNRYRTAGRTQNTADTSTGHMGFRCAASVPTPLDQGGAETYG